jgi:RNA polymerase sigma factor FliA
MKGDIHRRRAARSHKGLAPAVPGERMSVRCTSALRDSGPTSGVCRALGAAVMPGAAAEPGDRTARAFLREESMVTHVDLDVQQLWRDYKAEPTLELRNTLVELYLPLVKYNAERIWARLPDGVDLDDLISAGVFGLMDAIDAFDLERGVKFETYCVPRIRGAMLDELRTMDWVPRLVRSKHTKLEEARKRLEAELGRPPRAEEMAARLGMTIEDYEKLEGDATAVSLVSLNKKWYETDSYKDVREIDILEDKKAEDPTHKLQNRDLMRLVTRGLNRNERLIIILYYYEDMTMKEIGATLDLSESRVSQMHSSIVARLQQHLAKRRPEFSN